MFINAATACEHFHRNRSACQFSGNTVQLSVATFVGYVALQKMT
jgi:hypothetical protein